MITLQKIHFGDIITDNSGDWSDGPETAVVIGREVTGRRFELVWEDGVRSFERLSTLSGPDWQVTCTHA